MEIEEPNVVVIVQNVEQEAIERVSPPENINAQEQMVDLVSQQSNDTNPLEASVEIVNEENVSPNRKKRKSRTSSGKKISPKKMELYNEDDDDGSTCSICLDSWELGGEHALVALKCGHLFGENCIRRWLHECPSNGRCCPTCKSRAMIRDIRILYAKRVQAIDKSEEYRLKGLLEVEKTKNMDLQNCITTLRLELAVQKQMCHSLQMQVECAKMCGSQMMPSTSSASMQQQRSVVRTYRMALEKNYELNRETGSRVMVYGRRAQTLMIAQRSNGVLFAGYGIRFLNAYNLQLTNSFLHMSTKAIRDLALDAEEELIAAASMDSTARLFDVSNKAQVNAFTPNDQQIWAATFDRSRTKNLLLGSNRGNAYLYDIRNNQNFVEEFSTPGDFSPVTSITSVPVSNDLPFGGFIVCKLQSLWFYEYSATPQITPTKLLVEGPFNSVTYDNKTNSILISTRPNSKYPTARYIIGTLMKIDTMVVLNIVSTIKGSKTQVVMTRSTQIKMNQDNLVAAYMQDSNSLTMWNSMNGEKHQAMNVSDVVFDMCPLYVNNKTFLAALSEHRCRIFEINSV